MLTQLKLQHYRNFSHLVLTPHPHINLITGNNGSGKTNLLEAIYHLGTGKSFRTTLSQRIIQHTSESCQIYGCIQKEGRSLGIGVQRHKTEATTLHIDQASADNAAQLASSFLIRLINPDSFDLLIGGSKHRRQLLNWGVFHVEHTFWEIWRQAQRVLKQRNAALRKGLYQQVSLWNAPLSQFSEQIYRMQSSYCSLFEQIFQEVLVYFLSEFDIKLTHYAGWDRQNSLESQLLSDYPKDQLKGHTQHGPHRSDLRLRVNGNLPAKDILSRGQQKLVVCALLLAQGILLKRHLNMQCTFLLDDLAAELDETNLKRVCSLLEEMEAQVFITALSDRDAYKLFPKEKIKSFHVEQLSERKLTKTS